MKACQKYTIEFENIEGLDEFFFLPMYFTIKTRG